MYKQHIRRTLFFGVLGLVIAIVIALVTPAIYEGRLEILLGEAANQRQQSTVISPEVQAIIDRSQPGGAQTERQLLSSQSVFYQALARVADKQNRRELTDNWISYYKMYEIETARQTNQQIDAGVALLKVRAHSPQLAADIANEVSYVYNDLRRKNSKEAVGEAVRYIEGQMKEAQDSLKTAEENLRNFKRDNGVTDITLTMREATTYQSTLQQTVQQLVSQEAAIQGEIAATRTLIAKQPKNVMDSQLEIKNPNIQIYETQLADLTRARELALGTYLEDSVNVRTIDQAIATVKRKIADEEKRNWQSQQKNTRLDSNRLQMEANLSQATSRLDGVRRQLAETRSALDRQNKLIEAIPAMELKIVDYQRDVLIFDDKYRRLKVMSEDLKNRGEAVVRSALVLQSALPDDRPIAPDMQKLIFIGTIAGCCLGLLVSFTIDSLRQRVYSSKQLHELTGLPVIASVPALRGTNPARQLRALTRADAIPAEAFRSVAFSVISHERGTRTFMFTGIRTAQSSHISAAQFAIAIAKSGVKVALVDADLLKSPITKSFEMSGKPGLSNLLCDDSATLAGIEVAHATAHDHLMLVPAGTQSAKFLTDVVSSKLDEAIEALRLKAEVIVFAAPPCDVLADASCLTGAVDETCLVISATGTDFRNIPLAHDVLAKAGAKKVSLILADANPSEEAFAGKTAYLARVE